MKNRKIYYLIILIIIFSFSFTLFSNSIPYNLITGNLKKIKFISTVSPQGWGFFTKSPREDNVYIYSLTNSLVKSEMQPNNHYSNYFGISKKSRMVGYEVSMILTQLKHEKWSFFNGTFANDKKSINVDNSNLHFLKNGKYALVKEKITPYLWRKLSTPKKEIIYVVCSGKKK